MHASNDHHAGSRPFVVGIGGTAGGTSSTERALAIAMKAAAARGVDTQMFGGEFLARLPIYVPKAPQRTAEEIQFVETVRRADGLVIASPGYHGSVSGMIKNALDLLEETARDSRVYLSGMPVGLVVTAYGWQATGSTISALRSIVHALRGWPTPMAAAINTSASRFGDDGTCEDPAVTAQLGLIGDQVADFLQLHRKSA
ncbi:NADPH-dependent FMN reductase [Caulobacter sp. ErkDOM-E]|uniref:NADPH-dependent FMN reductase n=1 Tax=Caulobacter sp. ErkDOM-E TaxID=3402778 RepID=UPI003AF9A8BA